MKGREKVLSNCKVFLSLKNQLMLFHSLCGSLDTDSYFSVPILFSQ